MDNKKDANQTTFTLPGSKELVLRKNSAMEWRPPADLAPMPRKEAHNQDSRLG